MADSELRIIITAVNNAKAAIEQSIAQFNTLVTKLGEVRGTFLQGIAPENSLTQLVTAGERANSLSDELVLLSQRLSQIQQQSQNLRIVGNTSQGLTELEQLEQTLIHLQQRITDISQDKGQLNLASAEDLAELERVKQALLQISAQITQLKERSRQGLLSQTDTTNLRVLQTQLEGLKNQFLTLRSAGAGISTPKVDDTNIRKAVVSANNLKNSFKETESAASLLKRGLDNLANAASFVAGGFLAVQGIGFLKGLADTAARTEVLGTVLRIVARNSGITRDEIAKVDKSVQELGITAQSSRQSLAQFIQAGLDIGKAGELARAAQNLAPIGGLDSSETFQRLLVNIQQLDTVGLRHLGITVQRERAENDFARSIGKTADSLTDVERRQAVLNAVLEAAIPLQGIYTESMNDVGKQLTSLPRLHQELANAVGKNLLPAYSAIVREYSLFIAELTTGVETQNAVNAASNILAEAVQNILKALRDVVPLIIQFKTELTLLVTVFSGLVIASVGFRAIQFVVGGLIPLVKGLSEGVKTVATAFNSFGRATATSTIAINQTVSILSKFSSFIPILAAIIIDFKSFINLFTTLSSKVVETTSNLAKFFTEAKDGFGLLGAGAKGALVSVAGLAGILALPFLPKAISGLASFALRLLTIANLGRIAFVALGYLASKFIEVGNAIAGPPKADFITDLTKSLTDARHKVTDLETEIQNVELEGGPEAAGRLLVLHEELRLAKEIVKERQNALRDAQEQRDPTKKITRQQEEQKAKLALDAKKAKEELDKFNKDLDELFGKKFEFKADFSGLTTKGAATAISQMESLFEGFRQRLDSGDLTVDQFLFRTREAIVAAFGSQETVGDLEAFRKKIIDMQLHSKQLQTSFSELETTRTFKSQEAALSSLNKEMEGFKSISEKLISLQTTLRDLHTGTAEIQLSKEKVLLSVQEDRRKLADVELRQTALKTIAAQGEFDAATRSSEAFFARQRQLAKEAFKDQAGLGPALVGIDRRSNEERLKNGQTLFNALKAVAQDYLNQYQQQLQRVRDLDKQIKDSQKTNAAEVRDLRRQSLTEEQAYADKQKELAEQVDAAKTAARAGDEEGFRQAIARAKQLNSDLARGGPGVSKESAIEEAANQLEELGTLEKAFLENQKVIAQSAADNALKAFESIKTQMDKIKVELAESALKILSSVQVSVDQKQLQSQVDLVKSAFENIIANVNVEASLTVSGDRSQALGSQELTNAVVAGLDPLKVDIQQILVRLEDTVKFWKDAASAISSSFSGRAEGGSIPGVSKTGKEDNVLAWLTPEEFVQPVKAVRHYGTAFMESIRTLRFPKLGMGGMLKDSSIRLKDSFSSVSYVLEKLKDAPRHWQGGLVGTSVSNYMNSMVESIQNTIAPRSYAFGGTIVANAKSPNTIPGEHHSLTLQVGAKKMVVRGGRQDIRNLVSVLKEVSRGT